VYLTVNYDLQQFQIALAVNQSAGVVDIVPFDNTNSIDCPPPPRDNTYIGVIVVGCALFVVLIIVGAYLFGKRMQKKDGAKMPNDIPEAVPVVTTIPELKGDQHNGQRSSVITQSMNDIPEPTDQDKGLKVVSVVTTIPELKEDQLSGPRPSVISQSTTEVSEQRRNSSITTTHLPITTTHPPITTTHPPVTTTHPPTFIEPQYQTPKSPRLQDRIPELEETSPIQELEDKDQFRHQDGGSSHQ
jgi:hypothetical protein